MKKLLLFGLGFFVHSLFAQHVSTFATLSSNADVEVDNNGLVYVTSEGKTLERITPQGTIDTSFSIYGSSLKRASGLAFNTSRDTLYVTCRTLNGNGWISRVHPDGSDTVFSDSLYFPGDIAISPKGDLYVTEFNNTVRKIDSKGNKQEYVKSNLFTTSLGIAWTPGDTLYVSSAHNGNIFKIIPDPNGPQVQFFAHVDGLQQNWACGFMTYHNGHLYITNGDNKIHQISMNGEVKDFAGSGKRGGMDGSYKLAQFDGPNGICISEDGFKMFVSEYNKSRIRMIDLLTVGVPNNSIENNKLSIIPNPTTGMFRLNYSGDKIDVVKVFGLNGNLLKTFYDVKNTLDISDLQNGIYVLQVYSTKGLNLHQRISLKR